MNGLNIGNIGQEIRNRIEQVRARVGMRQPVLLRGQIGGGNIGQGKIIDQIRSRANQLVEKVRERKPNIIPKATEALKGWKLGERVKVLVEGEGTIPSRPTTTKTRPETPRTGYSLRK